MNYILDGHEAKPIADILDWARWYGTADRTVAKTDIGDVRVSTVFLGIDHQFEEEGPPLLFETMIFGGALDEEQWRYSTWDEAVVGHAAAVAQVAEPTP
jgi:hypothetical protein